MSLTSGFADATRIVTNDIPSLFAVGNYGYPTKNIEYAINRVQSNYWSQNLGYEFDVEMGTDGSLLGGLFSGGNFLSNAWNLITEGGGFSKFRLQINPQQLQQAENFAITVTPCQTGVVVEHQGFVTKSLTLAGSTGLKTGGETRNGYAEFQHLRNYIRAYAELKKDPQYRAMRLVFRNKKDNEHWYIEPIGPGLTLNRQARQPFMYPYVLNFVITGQANPYNKTGVSVIDDALMWINKGEEIINQVSEKITQGAELIHQTSDVIRSIVNSTALMITSPIDAVTTAVNAMKTAKTTICSVPRSFVSTVRTSCANLRDSLYDSVGGNNPDYDTFKGRTPDAAQDNPPFMVGKAIEGSLLLITALDWLLMSDVVFSAEIGSNATSSYSGDKDSLTAITLNSKPVQNARAVSNASMASVFGGSLNFAVPSSFRDTKVEYKDTLEKIAKREMGDATLWYQIALSNNLDPPYVSETPIANKNTLQYGSPVSIPVYGRSPSAPNYVLQRQEAKVTTGMSLAEKNLGVDLRLTKNNEIAYDEFAQDFHLIAGMENLAQACKIGLMLERGSLMYHPIKGIISQVGQKNEPTAQEIFESIANSLGIDSRIKSVENISVERNNNIIGIRVHVTPRVLDRPVPLQIEIEE